MTDDKATIQMLREALKDMRSGWRYIRDSHGDLYGVGWDRCEQSATAALTATAEDVEAWEKQRRSEVLEEAATKCENVSADHGCERLYVGTLTEAIRALKDKP
jgi:hypothetical protein